MAACAMDDTQPRRLVLFLAFIICLSNLSNAEFQSVDDYFTLWSETQWSDKLYPFGEEYLDPIVTRTIGDRDMYSSTEDIPFYGGYYRKLFASPHGFVKLTTADYSPESTIGHLPMPLQYGDSNTRLVDPVLIAPFHAKVGLFSLETTNGMSYRHLRTSGSSYSGVEREIELEMLNRLKTELHEKVIAAFDFTPTNAFIVTWFNITADSCTAYAGCEKNTYQLVILTDHVQTYTIMNYHDLGWQEWGSGNMAAMGFNAGDGLGFSALPYSGEVDATTKLPAIGRFFHHVTNDVITQEACINAQYSDAGILPSVYPRTGNMLGGYQIHISGFCLGLSDTVKCRFGSDEAAQYDGVVINKYRVACPVPSMTAIGDVMVYVHVNDVLFMETSFEVESPEHARIHLHLDNEEDWYKLDVAAAGLDLSWTPGDLYWHIMADTQAQNMPVDVQLYGIKEKAGTPNEYEWMLLETFSGGESNDGSYSIMPSMHYCPTTSNCDFDIGVVKVVLSDSNAGVNAIYSKPVPLAWYTQTAMQSQLGTDWANQKCAAWAEAEPMEPLPEDVPACPCTRGQAYTVSGEFLHAPDCGSSDGCPLSDAAYCIIQSFPSTTVDSKAIGSKCCYDSTNNLVYAGDAGANNIVERSYSFGYHPKGRYPYERHEHVPSLAHIMRDRMPWLWCCQWSGENENNCVFNYAQRRPTSACMNYQQPGIAMAYGDPHFRTFDGAQYTFNGFGEYHMLKMEDGSDTFELQGRVFPIQDDSAFEIDTDSIDPIQPAGVEYKGSALMAVAVQDTRGGIAGPKLQIHYTNEYARDRLALYVDDVRQDMHSWEAARRVYRGSGSASERSVGVANNDADVMNNMTLVFDNGVSVEVAGSLRLLHVTVRLPHAFHDKTKGLLGVWVDEISQSLTTPTGAVIDSDADLSTIHSQFGQTWLVDNPEDSLFTYFGDQSHGSFQNQDYEPLLEFDPDNVVIPPGSMVTNYALNQICDSGSDKVKEACKFDYIVMEDSGLAQATLLAGTWGDEQSLMAAHVATCEYVAAAHCRREVTHYLDGGQMIFTGAEDGYQLNGIDSYSCINSGGELMWSPVPDTHCPAVGAASNATAIAVTVVLLLLLLLILILLFIWYRRRNKQPADEVKQPPPIQAQNEGHLSKYPDPYINEGLSQSTASIHSRVSTGSVVLTEELQAKRPPRPKKTKRPQQEPNGHYDNIGADLPPPTDGTPRGPMYDNVPPADRSTPEPASPANPVYAQVQKPPPQGYDNPSAVQDSPSVNRGTPVRYQPPRPYSPGGRIVTGSGIDTCV